MPELTLEFEVRCKECGAWLECIEEKDRHGNPVIRVEPCGKCLEEAKDAGYDKGYDDRDRMGPEV
jgi:hypothetical protein